MWSAAKSQTVVINVSNRRLEALAAAFHFSHDSSETSRVLRRRRGEVGRDIRDSIFK